MNEFTKAEHRHEVLAVAERTRQPRTSTVSCDHLSIPFRALSATTSWTGFLCVFPGTPKVSSWFPKMLSNTSAFFDAGSGRGWAHQSRVHNFCPLHYPQLVHRFYERVVSHLRRFRGGTHGFRSKHAARAGTAVVPTIRGNRKTNAH